MPLSVAGADIGASVDAQQKALLIRPRHLAAGAKHRLTVVTKGRAESLLTTALVNTDSRVRYGMEQRRRPWLGPLVFLAGAAAVALWAWVLDQQGLTVEWWLVAEVVAAFTPLILVTGGVVMVILYKSEIWRRIKR